MPFALQLLGTAKATWDGKPLKFATAHTRALLAYVAIEPRQHERSTLAVLLWPEQPEAAARQNLRQTLLYLKQALRAVPQLERLLVITAYTVQFQAQAATVDVLQFRRCWAHCADQTPQTLAVNPSALDQLQQAAALYQGEFLQGFSLKQNHSFEDWLRYTREQLHRQALTILQTLTEYYALTGNYQQMQQMAARQLAMEPWLEEAHRQLMQALALSGQTAAALAHYAVCQRVLVDELGVPPGVETVALYDQIRAGKLPRVGIKQQEQFQAQAVHTATTSPHNLPAAASPFIGRDTELAELIALLQQSDIRLVTLLGPGGMGKTRLALEAAKLMMTTKRRYADGIFFVPLSSLHEPSAIASQVATTLKLPLSGDPRLFLLHTLQHKQMLLLLDNFEHLLPTALAATHDHADTMAVDLIADLLSNAPDVQILVTSRERLNLHSEHLYAISGLSFMAPSARGELSMRAIQETASETDAAADAMMNSAALRLFVQRARHNDASFQLDAAHLPAVLRICALVAGMPLGLEMAAAQAVDRPLAEIASELEKGLDVLSLTWHDLPPRQRSMRAVFEWSWRLLHEEERRVLRQLTVFRGGFTRAAAHAIVGATLSVLTQLVYKSLLYRTHIDTNEGRYDLHELLRQFAAPALAETVDERVAVERLHSAFYLDFTAKQEHRLARHEPGQAVVVIQHELDNVRKAWAWAAHHGDYARLTASAYSLWQFYLLTGLHAEGVSAFHLAVTGVQQALATSTASAIAIQEWQRLLSQLLGIQAHLLGVQGDYDEALTVAQAAITLGLTCGSHAGEVIGRMLNLQVFYHRGRLPETRAEAEQLWQCVTAHPFDEQPAEYVHDGAFTAQLYLGGVSGRVSDYAQARHHFTQALHLCQRLGKVRGTLHAQLNLANIERLVNNYDSAHSGYAQVLQTARQLNYRWGEGVVCSEFADVLRGQGEYRQALAMFERALVLLRAIHEPIRELYTAAGLSRLYSYLGNYQRAHELLTQAQALTAVTDLPHVHYSRWVAVAVFHYQTGDYSAALDAATHAQEAAAEDDSRLTMGIAAIYCGYALEALHEWRRAQVAYASAFDRFHQLALVPMLAEAHAGLARVALATNDLATAQHQVETILLLLADHKYVGLDEPFALYLTCYHVLAAAQDGRALSILQQGYRLLRLYAEKLADQELCRCFLEHVATHRELQQLYRLTEAEPMDRQ